MSELVFHVKWIRIKEKVSLLVQGNNAWPNIFPTSPKPLIEIWQEVDGAQVLPKERPRTARWRPRVALGTVAPSKEARRLEICEFIPLPTTFAAHQGHSCKCSASCNRSWEYCWEVFDSKHNATIFEECSTMVYKWRSARCVLAMQGLVEGCRQGHQLQLRPRVAFVLLLLLLLHLVLLPFPLHLALLLLLMPLEFFVLSYISFLSFLSCQSSALWMIAKSLVTTHPRPIQ